MDGELLRQERASLPEPTSTAAAPSSALRDGLSPQSVLPPSDVKASKSVASQATPALGELDEAALVARLRARDEAAFEHMVRTHGPRLLAVARRFLTDDADAQDALQDAFVSVFRSIDRFNGASRLGTWLHRIVVNASLMKIRSLKRRPEDTMGSLQTAEPLSRDGTGAAEWPSAVEAMARGETRARVREAVARIPDSYRSVLLLHDIEGIQIREIGTLLEISPGTVKMRLHRARHHLRKLLDPFMRGDRP